MLRYKWMAAVLNVRGARGRGRSTPALSSAPQLRAEWERGKW